MPGLLLPDAKCPECSRPIDVLVETASSGKSVQEYYHSDRKVPRKCIAAYDSLNVARMVRSSLEVHGVGAEGR